MPHLGEELQKSVPLLGKPVRKPHWGSELCLPSGGTRQAIPTETYSLKEGMKKWLPHYKLRLSAGTRQDLVTWESFLLQCNGITMLRHSKALIAHQLDIQVAVNQEGWQVEKGGHFLNGRWSLVLTGGKAAPGVSLFPWLIVTKV